ncbi:maleylpyruvate isomerase N-terminal domain-containing protein [Nocardioides ungokensis]|uniref:maleylpyruvate isomerase N-terminal domain-containing protein n=1 Tax=Nocardioides ungokensis TaxID=1643322 RepID=UPI0015DEF401|nr:maleylpyruvate isomerase N-terminal domain-containing protein [Nocardioides ungokensis]
MQELTFRHQEAVECFGQQLDDFMTAVSAQDDLQLLAPSRCHGWSLLDVVVHVRMGLQEMAIGTTCRTDDAPDHDAASYWATHPDTRNDDPVSHILWLRRVASAYARPTGAVAHMKDVATSAVNAVRSMSEGVVEFQGKRMASGDFLATWVVELAVHQLDLGIDGDSPTGLAWSRMTVEAVASSELPSELDDRSAVLIGLGRMPCPPSTRLEPPYPVSL